jgi:hypothetical protein
VSHCNGSLEDKSEDTVPRSKAFFKVVSSEQASLTTISCFFEARRKTTSQAVLPTLRTGRLPQSLRKFCRGTVLDITLVHGNTIELR